MAARAATATAAITGAAEDHAFKKRPARAGFFLRWIRHSGFDAAHRPGMTAKARANSGAANEGVA
jgi:hypothetical protein